MKKILLPLVLAFAGLLSGCSNGSSSSNSTPTLTSITVTPANATVPVGTLTPFTATGNYSDGSMQDLTATATWTSSNTAVATVASGGTNGMVTALAINANAIMIKAMLGTVSGETGLTVGNATLTTILVCPTPYCGPGGPAITIANGTSYQFTAWGLYNDGSRRNITGQATWASETMGVATIASATGRAQAVGTGSTIITAVLGSAKGMATLDVSAATLVSIVVGPSTYTIAPLTVQSFVAIGTFSDSSTQNITPDVFWASSNTQVATISNTAGSIGVATGVLLPPSGATTTITATLGGVVGPAPLNVSSATLTGITVTAPSAGMALGSTLPLQVVGDFSDGTTQHIETVAVCSSSAGTATVSGTTVTGVSNGSAAIICQLGGVESNAVNLTVEGLTAIGISTGNKGGLSVASGTAIGLEATGTLADGTTQDLTNSVLWTSSSAATANMSDALGSFGQAIANAPGGSTVTAVFSGQIAVASLTVTDATLTSLTITPANPAPIDLGARLQFTVKGTFSDSTTENLLAQVVWSSSEITTAIVNNTGAISTTGTGTTTIGVALDGVNDTTSLTVQ